MREKTRTTDRVTEKGNEERADKEDIASVLRPGYGDFRFIASGGGLVIFPPEGALETSKKKVKRCNVPCVIAGMQGMPTCDGTVPRFLTISRG